jgi:hypothetical protein
LALGKHLQSFMEAFEAQSGLDIEETANQGLLDLGRAVFSVGGRRPEELDDLVAMHGGIVNGD